MCVDLAREHQGHAVSEEGGRSGRAADQSKPEAHPTPGTSPRSRIRPWVAIVNTMTDPTSRLPQLHADAFDCPRCSAFSQQDWENIQFEEQGPPRGRIVDDSPGEFTRNSDGQSHFKSQTAKNESQWRTSTCRRCEKRTVWRGEQIIYPPSSPAPLAHPDMPESVAALYNEARAVAAASRRAGAALARAALERLLKELDPEAPTKARLDDRIARVSVRVTSPTAKLLTVCRHVGNESLHGGDNPDEAVILLLTDADSKLMDAIFESINLVVDDLITRPARVDKIYDTVPIGVREGAEAKARKNA